MDNSLTMALSIDNAQQHHCIKINGGLYCSWRKTIHISSTVFPVCKNGLCFERLSIYLFCDDMWVEIVAAGTVVLHKIFQVLKPFQSLTWVLFMSISLFHITLVNYHCLSFLRSLTLSLSVIANWAYSAHTPFAFLCVFPRTLSTRQAL